MDIDKYNQLFQNNNIEKIEDDKKQQNPATNSDSSIYNAVNATGKFDSAIFNKIAEESIEVNKKKREYEEQKKILILNKITKKLELTKIKNNPYLNIFNDWLLSLPLTFNDIIQGNYLKILSSRNRLTNIGLWIILLGFMFYILSDFFNNVSIIFFVFQ